MLNKKIKGMSPAIAPSNSEEGTTSCKHLGEILYSKEHDNFYCAECNQGMGIPYYRAAKELREYKEQELQQAREHNDRTNSDQELESCQDGPKNPVASCIVKCAAAGATERMEYRDKLKKEIRALDNERELKMACVERTNSELFRFAEFLNAHDTTDTGDWFTILDCRESVPHSTFKLHGVSKSQSTGPASNLQNIKKESLPFHQAQQVRSEHNFNLED